MTANISNGNLNNNNNYGPLFDYPGEPVPEQTSTDHPDIIQSLSASSIYYDP